jgi:hypothetical protein
MWYGVLPCQIEYKFWALLMEVNCKLQLSLDEICAGSTDEVKVTRAYVNLHKCAWVVHNLISHDALRTNRAESVGIKQIIDLIIDVSFQSVEPDVAFEMLQTREETIFTKFDLQKLHRAFTTHDKRPSRAAASLDINSCDLSIRDPFASPIEPGNLRLRRGPDAVPRVCPRN